MANPFLNPALTGFRAAVNRAFPERDKASDGWIGDPAHQARTSDHNPDPDASVDAWDMDVEVNGRGRSYAADVEALKRVFEAHPSSNYWIHNDQIAKRSEGWQRRSYAYAGPERNRHTQHVHFNTRESHENSTSPWNVEGDDMTPEEHAWLKEIRERMIDSHFTLTAIPNPIGTGERVPLHVAMAAMDKQMDTLLTEGGDLSPEELAEVKKATMEGAKAGWDPAAIAAAIPDTIAQEVVDLLRARLES